MTEIRIEIAGICCLIKTPDKGIADMIRDNYFSFLSTNVPELDILLQTNNHTPVLKNIEVTLHYDDNTVFITRADLSGSINLSNWTAEVTVSKQSHSFDSFLRVLFSLALAERMGFLIHSTGFVKNDKGYIFAGPKFSGKTTIAGLVLGGDTFPANPYPDKSGENINKNNSFARICSQNILLSDEIIAVRKQGDIFYLFGTPFQGSMRDSAQNGSSELSNIFLFGEKLAPVRNLTPSDAVYKLLPNVLFFTCGHSNGMQNILNLTTSLFSLCCDLCRNVSCSEIGLEYAKELINEIR
ncbi:MAG: hypothetical protein HY769_03380 [Candidatus Stahlbacteria bacterium]|nr:hypothetical protein [Candidatus Stahlbacteria bacterium]